MSFLGRLFGAGATGSRAPGGASASVGARAAAGPTGPGASPAFPAPAVPSGSSPGAPPAPPAPPAPAPAATPATPPAARRRTAVRANAGSNLVADLRSAWSAASGQASVELRPEGGAAGPLDSKIGGEPYLPPGQAWPTLGANGPDLFLLAQLNFGQLPPLAGFPARGLLQFFISGDDTHGMDYRDPVGGPGHLVLYHPDLPTGAVSAAAPPSGARPDLSRAVEYMDVPFSVAGGVRLTGRAASQPMPPGDFRFESAFARFLASDEGADVAERLRRGGSVDLRLAFASKGHRLGGYPRLPLSDPRVGHHLSRFTTLLLQLDSDESAGIVWGEGGAAGFFIEPERLAARDFSRVLYSWDCP
ncbi:MAG: DUF1963 domain-containing protein [Bifidobacteriaceae bacterium]|nr:DUF1963 domain-containing protein [Bifidobacteriaceae bacterium]